MVHCPGGELEFRSSGGLNNKPVEKYRVGNVMAVRTTREVRLPPTRIIFLFRFIYAIFLATSSFISSKDSIGLSSWIKAPQQYSQERVPAVFG